MSGHLRQLALVTSLAALGCGPSQADIEALRDGQQQILEKLTALDQKLGAARPAAAAQRAPEDFDRVYEIPIEQAPVRGGAGAAVTIVEFSDFQCPFCAQTQPMLKQALEKYGERVRLVYKHFPLAFHAAAMPTAIASGAAQEQGKFWELHDVLFEQGRDLTAEKIDDYAQKAGLDMARFRDDLVAKQAEYQQRAQQDYRHGLEADVRGTPTLYVNGKKLRDRSVEGLVAQIEAELGKGG